MPRTQLTRRFLVPAAIVSVLTAVVVAQDHLQWKEGLQAPGPRLRSGALLSYAAVHWDPDGAGPRGPVLVVGGQFNIPSLRTSNLVWFDPVRGEYGTFPAVPNGAVLALTVLPTGELVAGGSFNACGAQSTGPLAVWNGTTWGALGGGVSGGALPEVRALQVMPNGELVVGGRFDQAGALAANGLARWNGAQWDLFSGFSVPATCLGVRQSGSLVVGGDFPGGVSEWNGSYWAVVGAGLPVVPDEIAITATDEIVAATSMFGLRRWDGTAWTLLGSMGLTSNNKLLPLPNGDLLVSGLTTVGSLVVNGVGRWDGSQWSVHVPEVQGIDWMLPDTGAGLWLGGRPSTPGARGIVHWDGSVLRPATNGFDDAVGGMSILPNGEVFAHGWFRAAGGTDATHAARWNGAAWVSMSSPTSWWEPVGSTCSTVDAAGTLWFSDSTVSNGAVVSTVMRRSGITWQAVGTALPSIAALVVDAGQNPIVGCATYGYSNQPVRRWTGTVWQALGALDGPVYALLRRANGELIAGGDFLFAGSTAVSRIARWNGTAWLPLATGFDGAVRALAELPNGDLVAVGDFVSDGNFVLPLNHVARFDGAAWQWFGSGLAGSPLASVRAALVLANGDLVVGGDFQWAGSGPANHVARWDGVDWRELDGGCDGPVWALAQAANGEVFVGGAFGMVGGKSSAHVGRLRTDAPAEVTAYGGGCTSSAGVLSLQTSTLPWLGATVTTETFGVPANAFGIVVTGTTAAQVPLSSLHPAGVAGCQLLANPVSIGVVVPSGGVVVGSVAVPRTPLLLGTDVFHQVLVVELGAGGVLQRLAGTNGLRLRLGTF